MLVKTKGILLNRFSYNDNNSIIHVYTEEFGRMSYIIRNPKRNKSVFIPMSILEIEASHKENRDLQRVRNISIAYTFTDMPFNPVKCSINMFIAEVLYKALREMEKNENLFDFLTNSIRILDINKCISANFHIVFLLKLTKFLGFYPNIEKAGHNYFFDFAAGEFVKNCPPHNYFIPPSGTNEFLNIMSASYENMDSLCVNRRKRTTILKHILDYYRIHIPDFSEIKSLKILEEIFD